MQYTNIEVKKLVAGIRANNPQAVIIFLSDHGYRWNVPAAQLSHVFYNQNAVYLPSGQYGKFYNSITNVNQFRVIFNSLFGTQYPLLKDTSHLRSTRAYPALTVRMKKIFTAPAYLTGREAFCLAATGQYRSLHHRDPCWFSGLSFRGRCQYRLDTR